MHFGHPPHTHSAEDLTVLHCRHCDWYSDEMTRDQMREHGHPLHCERCGKYNAVFVTFHPSERAAAYEAIGKPLKP